MQYLALAAQLPNVLFNWMNVFLQLRSTSGLNSRLHLYCYIYLHYYLYVIFIFILIFIVSVGT